MIELFTKVSIFFNKVKEFVSGWIMPDENNNCQRCITKIRFQVVVIAVGVMLIREGVFGLLASFGMI